MKIVLYLTQCFTTRRRVICYDDRVSGLHPVAFSFLFSIFYRVSNQLFGGFRKFAKLAGELRDHIIKQAINHHFLGSFTISRKANINFVMSGRLSFRVEQLGSHWKNVHET
jgi:hypothetical protein